MAFARLFGKNKKDPVEQHEDEGEEGREEIQKDTQDMFAGCATEAKQGEDTPSMYPRYLLDYQQQKYQVLDSISAANLPYLIPPAPSRTPGVNNANKHPLDGVNFILSSR